MKKNIICAARDSLLSIAQTKEVFQHIHATCPEIIFKPLYIKTRGDYDKTTSLRTLEKSDFFTREIDELVLNRTCDMAIHSAKDLPDPLQEKLCVIAMTKALDSRDALVYLNKLSEYPLVATSSQRREESVRKMFPLAHFTDIRGTIQERLTKLYAKEFDALVIAEAALIRLELTHLPRLFLEGETAPFQGRLAIVARNDNEYVRKILNCFDLEYFKP